MTRHSNPAAAVTSNFWPSVVVGCCFSFVSPSGPLSVDTLASGAGSRGIQIMRRTHRYSLVSFFFSISLSLSPPVIWCPWLPSFSGVALATSRSLPVCSSLSISVAISPLLAARETWAINAQQAVFRVSPSRRVVGQRPRSLARRLQSGSAAESSTARPVGFFFYLLLFFACLFSFSFFLSLSRSLVKWCFRIYSSCSVDSRRIDGWDSAVFRPNKRRNAKC